MNVTVFIRTNTGLAATDAVTYDQKRTDRTWHAERFVLAHTSEVCERVGTVSYKGVEFPIVQKEED